MQFVKISIYSLVLVVLIALLFYIIPSIAYCETEMTTSSSTIVNDSQDDKSKHTNRLINETSPYLLQHAHNPVDWYPWGEEAFEKAKQENKLIFLSVGYSTCYWCHVMERESFENEEIAKLMNDNFVCIKVDREERPDVDDIYMMAVQLINRRGGWPMSVWLDPATLKPVHAGTYFPAKPRGGMITFPDLLQRIADAWLAQQDDLKEYSDRVAQAVIDELSAPTDIIAVNQVDVDAAINALLSIYDEQDGGFAGAPQRAPKFPQPVFIELLLDVRDRLDDDLKNTIDQAVTHTLNRMAMGGMYDQVGGGFHRYSTDEKWLVPHFEKMLYDNGQLLSLYSRASEIYNDSYYAEIVRETVAYLLREMQSDNRAFYSAQDAEVNHREGQNYLWSVEEVRTALSKAGRDDLIDFALTTYGLSKGTNFQDPHHTEDEPKNVLFLSSRPNELAEKLGMDESEFNKKVIETNAILLKVRDKRDQPSMDDKTIIAWNGMVIAGLAVAGSALDKPEYIQVAKDAADFILSEMRDTEGTLLRTHRNGKSKIKAFIEDYSMLIKGLLAIHNASGEKNWLDVAEELAAKVKADFQDEINGGYYDTLPDQADLFVRTKSTYDGALPSGSNIMLRNLIDLYKLTNKEQYLVDAASALSGMSSAIRKNPLGTVVATSVLEQFVLNWPDRLPQDSKDAETTDAINIVSIATDREIVKVGIDGSEVVRVTLQIDEGYHINAHEPGDETLIGLLITVVDGEGVVAQAGYPDGELYQGDIRVHHGVVTIPVTFELIGEITGNPKLAVTWQTCNDTECLAPETKTLNIKIVGE